MLKYSFTAYLFLSASLVWGNAPDSQSILADKMQYTAKIGSYNVAILYENSRGARCWLPVNVDRTFLPPDRFDKIHFISNEEYENTVKERLRPDLLSNVKTCNSDAVVDARLALRASNQTAALPALIIGIAGYYAVCTVFNMLHDLHFHASPPGRDMVGDVASVGINSTICLPTAFANFGIRWLIFNDEDSLFSNGLSPIPLF